MAPAPWGCVGPMKKFSKSSWKMYQMLHTHAQELFLGWKQTGPLRCLQQAEAIPNQERKIILEPHAFSKSSELETIPEALCKGLAPHE